MYQKALEHLEQQKGSACILLDFAHAVSAEQVLAVIAS